MKIILAQPGDVERFKWQIEVLLVNLKSLGFPLKDVILLFAAKNNAYEEYFKAISEVEAHTYPDLRTNRSYIPSIRPYLWMKFLEEDPQRENETYLYVDSDVIFRELPQVPDELSAHHWYCADTCGYTNYTYVKTCPYGDEIAPTLNQIAGVSENQLQKIDSGMGGAQWLIKDPKALYWKSVYQDCINFYKYFKSIPDKTNDNSELPGGLQIWTAEMYAQVWDLPRFGIMPQVTDELSFSWATDDIDEFDQHKIYHDAGVTEDMTDVFFKGNFTNKAPYKTDLSFVTSNKCSYKYVEAIKKAGEQLYGIKRFKNNATNQR